jgi:O-phospho-L-seryl-tRNASec:L-selenocysteinyl-tRNA synthase
MGIFDSNFIKKLSSLGIPPHMLERATIGLNARFEPIIRLLDQQSIPDDAWDDTQIRELLIILNSLDSDKDPGAIRIGEREARIATPLLNELSGGFTHGIGRSGYLSAPQPKAAGGSIMQNLTNKCVYHFIRDLGLPNIKGALTVPFGTGMALGLAVRGCAAYYDIILREKPDILMPRIDHHSPKKGIEFINCQTIPIETQVGPNYYAPNGVYCSLDTIKAAIEEHKATISGIISTTTFFAPRVPDDVKGIAKLAKEYNLIHVINNAYGIQCPEILQTIRSAIDAGRVDAIVQSTDKNFLTPVGGAIITSPNPKILDKISQSYAGRASATPVLELLVALLALGKQKYKDLIEHQKLNRKQLEEAMRMLASELGEDYIESNNPVSCAMTLTKLNSTQISKLGGYLYNLRITGPRVVDPTQNTFGASTEGLKTPYIVMNAAIGADSDHIKMSIEKLRVALKQVSK